MALVLLLLGVLGCAPPHAGERKSPAVESAVDQGTAGLASVVREVCAEIDSAAVAAANLRDSDAATGLANAEALLQRAEAAGCPLAQARAARGDNLLTLGRFREALAVYQLATEELSTQGASASLASVLRRAGAAYYFMGELDRALERYRASLAMAEGIGDRLEAGKSLGNIGALYVKIGWLDEALQVQERALADFQSVYWQTGIAGTAVNVSHVHGELGDRALLKGDTSEARTHYAAMDRTSRRAYTQFAEIGNTRGVAAAAANVGIATTDLGRYEEGLRWHERALALRRTIRDVQGEVTSLGTMALTLIRLGRLDDAEASLRAADSLLAGMAPSDRKLVAQSWVELLRARGDYAGALERLREVAALSDAIAAGDYGARVKTLETRYLTERMAQQITQLESRQTIADLRLARSRLWLSLAVITSTLLTALFVVVWRAFQASRRAARELQHAVRTDHLTGLTNRLGIYERIEYERLRSLRNRRPFSLALIDLDDFKKVNDEHGHEAGDAVLAQVAREIGSQLRAQDTAARWGGEEFLLLLPDTDASGAAVIARKVGKAVAGTPLDVGGKERGLTITVGLCEYHPDLTISQCIKYADEAMYAGKQGGKSRVVTHGALDPEVRASTG